MLWERYSEPARRAMLNAEDWAIGLKSPHIAPEHILLGLLEVEDSLAIQFLERLGVDIPKLKLELETKLREQAPSEPHSGSPTLTSSAKQVLIRAADEARGTKASHIGTVHLLLGLLREGRSLATKILANYGVRYEDAMRILSEWEAAEIKAEQEKLKVQTEKPSAPSPTPTFKLDDYVEDWTVLAASGVFRKVSFWQKERTRFAIAINQKNKPNILLLGNYETAFLLVQQFACDFTQPVTALCFSEGKVEEVQVHAFWHRLLRLDWTELQLDATVMQLLKEVRKMTKKPLLFVGTVDDIVYWSDAMLAAVQQGGVPVIAIATPTKWEKFKSNYPAAASTFTVITVDEPNESQVLEWLKAHKTVYADAYFATVDDDALTAIIELAKERFPNQPLLATARNLLDEVCTYAWIKAIKPPEEIRKLKEEIDRLGSEARRALAASEQERAAELLSKKQDLQIQYDKMMSEWRRPKPQVTVETVREFAELL